jgi:choline dehydrogenase-like flavoprotein
VNDPDVLVVGSGCAGAIAAETLALRGARVLVLDVGLRDERYAPLVPAKPFLEVRRTEPDQHRYLLGDDLEGLPRGPVGSGAQLTPPRRHLVSEVDRLLPILSDTFAPVESLAQGGLGGGWGVGCNAFSAAELAACGLDAARVRDAYRAILPRVGVSGARDDAAPYTCGALDGLQPPSEPDRNGRALLARYARVKPALNRDGFFLGRPSLALLTRDQDGRRATAYRDMDFYEDRDQSAFRPAHLVDRLRARPGFEYRAGKLALSFREEGERVLVESLDVRTGALEVASARRLVLAAGVLGTARIVLRSSGAGAGARLPVLCNPYAYVPCLAPRMLGSGPDAPRTSFAQAMLFHDPRGDGADVAQASLYSYGSLLLFRLVSEVPLDLRAARELMAWLSPALVIAGVHQPEPAEHAGRLWLVPDPASPTGDRLAVDYPVSAARRATLAARQRAYGRALRRLGCWPLAKVEPRMGASIHYAGPLPFSDEERPLTLARDGRLHGHRRVFVADASGLRYLPAKGLTFTLMAQAHLAAEAALS